MSGTLGAGSNFGKSGLSPPPPPVSPSDGAVLFKRAKARTAGPGLARECMVKTFVIAVATPRANGQATFLKALLKLSLTGSMVSDVTF